MKKESLLVAFLAVLFTFLFYKQSPGLNLFIFDLVLLVVLLILGGFKSVSLNGWIIISGVVITAIFVLIHASSFVITMNIISLFLLGGWLIYPAGRSMVSLLGLSFENIVGAPVNAVTRLWPSGKNRTRAGHIVRQIALFIVPAILILFFLAIYRASNPTMSAWMTALTNFLDKWITIFFRNVNFSLLGVFLLGLAISVYFIWRGATGDIPSRDGKASDFIPRRRKLIVRMRFRTMSLKSEYRAIVILLICLNLLIVLQNILDIRWIWFGFEWNGSYLRQFVHEGTFLLILSILVSIAIILWSFRGNLNYYPGNRLLKGLSYAWIIQNLILAISVGFRVYWYIHYFALAYLRIGVIIFLIITIAGLVTILVKIRRKNSFFYLLRVNALSVFSVLVIASCFNWDVIIAKYNFSSHQQSFVHLDWLCTLSDKALPYLDKSPEFLADVMQCQDKRFSFETKYMEPEKYRRIIMIKKSMFIKEMTKRSFLSWNLADDLAFRKLRETQKSP